MEHRSNNSRKKSWIPGGVFDPEGLREQIRQQEQLTHDPEFWNDRDNAEHVMGELKKLKDRLEPWEEMMGELEDLVTLYELSMEMEDESQEEEINSGLLTLSQKYEKMRVMELLSDEMDDADAFLTIHAGAGGTEACDWASMLFRMYSRWCENRSFKAETMDFLEAEGGIKSVTIQVSGSFAHGFLKSESGVHRLVRISPFDSGARRHTSFASVYVSPVINDDVEVEIKSDELRIDTYRAQGAGGQHVNKTESAVRITHLPTNIVVQCQNERSQHKNRDRAMKVLKSRLYEHYKAEQEAELAKSNPEKREISWGSQIRSYVFQPYTMVKDHRTKHETGNIQAVMDGSLDSFIEEYLKFVWANSHTT